MLKNKKKSEVNNVSSRAERREKLEVSRKEAEKKRFSKKDVNFSISKNVQATKTLPHMASPENVTSVSLDIQKDNQSKDEASPMASSENVTLVSVDVQSDNESKEATPMASPENVTSFSEDIQSPPRNQDNSEDGSYVEDESDAHTGSDSNNPKDSPSTQDVEHQSEMVLPMLETEAVVNNPAIASVESYYFDPDGVLKISEESYSKVNKLLAGNLAKYIGNFLGNVCFIFNYIYYQVCISKQLSHRDSWKSF